MTREEFMDMVYSELHSDGDNYRANRIIDAADEYVETEKESNWIPVNDAHNEGFDVGYWAGRQDYEPKWIPVSERLPEKYKRVIVSDVFDSIYIREFVDAEESWGGKHFINEHGMHSKSVKAWMPLPEPYKGE